MVLTFSVSQNGDLSVSNKIFYTYINKEEDFFNIFGESLENFSPSQDSVIGNWTDAVNFMLKMTFAVIDMKAVPVIIFKINDSVKFAYNNNGKMTLVIPENGDKIYTTFAEAYSEEASQVEAHNKKKIHEDLISKKMELEKDNSQYRKICESLNYEIVGIRNESKCLMSYIEQSEKDIKSLQTQISVSREKISKNDKEIASIENKIKLFNETIDNNDAQISVIDKALMC